MARSWSVVARAPVFLVPPANCCALWMLTTMGSRTDLERYFIAACPGAKLPYVLQAALFSSLVRPNQLPFYASGPPLLRHSHLSAKLASGMPVPGSTQTPR